MPKAILELPEMPNNCRECLLCVPYLEIDICTGIPEVLAECPNTGKRPDCPLKLVEEREGCAYCTPDDNGEYLARAFYCEKEKEHITVMFCDNHAYITIRTKDNERTASTPIYYCPMCGRKLEVEE